MADDEEYLQPPPEPERPEDLGDPRDVALRQRRSKDKRQTHLETLGQIMSSPMGRAFIYEILTWCHLGQNPFSTNALAMAHACGELNIGTRILADISVACPQQYTVMMSENQHGR